MKRSILAAVLAPTVALAGCGHPPITIAPLTPINDVADGIYTTIETNDRWTLELSDDRPCVRLRVDDRVSGCVGAISPGMTAIGTFGGGPDPRFVLAVFGTPNAIVRYYSNRNSGTSAATTTVPDATIAVIELADDEDPWGLQVLTDDGNLSQATSLID